MLVWASVSKRYIDLPDRFQECVCEAVGLALVDLLKLVDLLIVVKWSF